MRSILCVVVVCSFVATASAEIGAGPGARGTAKAGDALQKKTTNDKGRAGKAGVEELAAAEAELADALLIAMDLDKDGVVTKVEMNKAMAALRKVHKDAKGNMTVPDKAATDPNAAAAAGGLGAQPNQGLGQGLGQGQPGDAAAGAGDQRNNDAMARFMTYDTNHDGVLSQNELPPQGRAMLREADLNRDGVLDAKELQAFSRMMGDRARGVAPNGVQNGVQNGAGLQGGRRP